MKHMVFRLKQIILSVLYRIDQCVPLWLGVCLRNRCWPWRPVLDAVELHLADRCNMNCTGCSHFSPFADEWYASPERVIEDLRRLSSKFGGRVRHVNVLGGEPLLNKDLRDIICRIRAAFPHALLTMVTNGLVLLDQSQEFWEMCRRARLRINVTLYAPMAAKCDAIERKGREEGVALRVQKGDEFFAKMLPCGDGDARKSFRFCRKTTYCPYLRDGRLYTCAQAFHIRDFIRVAKKAGIKVDEIHDDGIDLRTAELNGMDILRYLMSPGVVCRFCADHVRLMRWSNGSKDVRDWCLDKTASCG